MKTDDSRIINRISKEQGVNYSEAEKAIDMFYNILREEIIGPDFKTLEVKHLGKFIPKKKPNWNGTGVNSDSGRDTNVQSICKND